MKTVLSTLNVMARWQTLPQYVPIYRDNLSLIDMGLRLPSPSYCNQMNLYNDNLSFCVYISHKDGLYV